ncbi:hypothetical protein G6F46_014177 [Rhizopus delemar]|nr:hypothetical protein G6F46_014177 [Rhizopus delemar]
MVAGLLPFLPFMDSMAEAYRIASVERSLDPILMAMRVPLTIFAIIYVVSAALVWHAPVLVAWHGLRLIQALFFSGIACWRNKWPFLVYGAPWALVFLFIDLVPACWSRWACRPNLPAPCKSRSTLRRAAFCIAASILPIPPCSASIAPPRISTTATAPKHRATRQGASALRTPITRSSGDTNATSMA